MQSELYFSALIQNKCQRSVGLSFKIHSRDFFSWKFGPHHLVNKLEIPDRNQFEMEPKPNKGELQINVCKYLD